MNIDVIMLTDSDTNNMIAKRTIATLRDSEKEHNFNIILMDSAKNGINPELINISNHYSNIKEPFNYNRFINLAAYYLSDADWIVISNNDISYEKGWFSEILKVHEERPDITSFSPKDPMLFMRYFPHHFVGTDSTYFESYQVTEALQGWCIVIKKESLKKILPLDELFDMYYQDNDFAEMLKLNHIKHALCRHSIACHLSTFYISHPIPPDKSEKLKSDEYKFRSKWNIWN